MADTGFADLAGASSGTESFVKNEHVLGGLVLSVSIETRPDVCFLTVSQHMLDRC